MNGRQRPRRCSARDGFTIVEILVALAVGLIVVAGAYEVLFSHSRLYSTHSATMDVRQSLRAAAALMAWELAGATPAVGDIYGMGPGSITFRSLQGTGVVCAAVKIGVNYRFGLQEATGYFEATADDSAVALRVKDGSWNVVNVSKAFNKNLSWDPAPSGGGTPVCFWGDSTTAMPRPQATLELQGDTAVLNNLVIGAPVRAFRRTQYALFPADGHWWLGRRVGNAPGWETITGPLLSPSEGGLVLDYSDVSGAPTADPNRVARVDIMLRAKSYRPATASGSSVRDSLMTTVFVRGGSLP